MLTRRADELEIGDRLLNYETGEYDSTVEDVFTDNYGTWLDTGDSMGYVESKVKYRVEPTLYD